MHPFFAAFIYSSMFVRIVYGPPVAPLIESDTGS